MKKMRIPLLISVCIAILGIVFGSVFDFQLSSAIASKTNMVGISISVIGPTIGFMGLALPAGGFIALAKQKRYKTSINVLLILGAVLYYAIGVFFAGREYFSSHGFYGSAPYALGFVIAAVPLAGGVFLGYKVFKNTDHPYAWLVLLLFGAVTFMAMIPGTVLLKEIFHRPRFRAINDYEAIVFHNWWERCKNYKDLMALYNIEKEEFQSFPSGHTTQSGTILVFVAFMPLLNRKLEKFQMGCFIGAFAFVLLIGFARILAAAHFLSDVSFGIFLTTFCTFVANEIALRVKKFQPLEVTAE